MSYESDHAGALADVAEAGAAVTFTLERAGLYDPATDTSTGATTTTVAGYAVQVEGDPERYRALGLVEGEAPTLLFVPSTFGALPPLGARVTWASASYTVRAVDPLRPDGNAILANVIVAR